MKTTRWSGLWFVMCLLLPLAACNVGDAERLEPEDEGYFVDGIPGSQYVGCFEDAPNRALSPSHDGALRSINDCIEYCAGSAAFFAGLQYGGECYCGEEVRYDRRPEEECSMPCLLGSGTCGGAYRNSIYSIGGPPAVRLFADIDNGGGSFFANGELAFVGGDWNDLISSVDNPGGRTVVLYEHDGFGGQSLTLDGSARDLRAFAGPGPDGTWNDAVSSILVH